MATSYIKLTLEFPADLIHDLDNLLKKTGLSRRASIIEAMKDWMAKEALRLEKHPAAK